MKEKLGPAKAFRPKGKTRERIEFAEKLGINVSDLVNRILDEHLRDYLAREVKQQQAKWRELINAPVP